MTESEKYQKLLEFTKMMSKEKDSRLEGCFYFKLAVDVLKEIGELHE